jgi:hypothetical protein
MMSYQLGGNVMKNSFDKMLDITLFVRAGQLNGKAFEPQPFYDAIEELEDQFKNANFLEIVKSSDHPKIQKRAKEFIVWYKNFIKSNPYDREKMNSGMSNPERIWGILDHIKEFMAWQLIAKEQFKIALADCYDLCHSQAS